MTTNQKTKDSAGSMYVWVVASVAIYFLLALIFNVSYSADQSFVDLARSFLVGRLDLVGGSTYDTVFWNGRYYWPFGPLPAIILMPGVFVFSLFGEVFYQGYLQFIFGVIIAFLCFQIMRRVGYDKNDALYGVLAFCGASMFLGVYFIPNYSFFAHVITVLFLLLALFEYFGQKRFGLIGLAVGLGAATRPTALAGALFFLGSIIFSSARREEKIRRSLQVLAPIIFIGICVGVYNAVRFGSPLETGYALQTLSIPELIFLRSQGLMSIVHVPHNIYYALLSVPHVIFSGGVWSFPFLQPNPWGMSMVITSPYLVRAAFFTYASTESRLLLATIGIIALPLFLYYGIGYWQFGYRYALDFFPFLFVLFFKEYRARCEYLSSGMRFTLLASFWINLYLFLSLLLYRPAV